MRSRFASGMVQLPCIGLDDDRRSPHLVVKQESNGTTFVVSGVPIAWADEVSSESREVRAPRVSALRPARSGEIAEAMAEMNAFHEVEPDWSDSAAF